MQGCLESFWALGHIKNLGPPCNTFVVPLTMGARGKLPLLPPVLAALLVCIVVSHDCHMTCCYRLGSHLFADLQYDHHAVKD